MIFTRWRKTKPRACSSRNSNAASSPKVPIREAALTTTSAGRADLVAQGCDLSLNCYQEVIHAEVAHRPPGEILAALANLEKEIVLGMRELETMLAKPTLAK